MRDHKFICVQITQQNNEYHDNPRKCDNYIRKEIIK